MSKGCFYRKAFLEPTSSSYKAETEVMNQITKNLKNGNISVENKGMIIHYCFVEINNQIEELDASAWMKLRKKLIGG